MKVYRATYTLYVVSDCEMHAKFAANEADITLSEWEIDEVNSIDEVDPEWQDVTPWAETCEQQDMLGSITIRQLLERWAKQGC